MTEPMTPAILSEMFAFIEYLQANWYVYSNGTYSKTSEAYSPSSAPLTIEQVYADHWLQSTEYKAFIKPEK